MVLENFVTYQGYDVCLHATVVWKMLLLYFSSRKLPFKNLQNPGDLHKRTN